MELRGRTHKWLIGQPISGFTGGKLPSNRQVLQLFFFHRSDPKLKIRQCSWKVIQAAEQVWTRACIPTKTSELAVKSLEKLHKVWVSLRKCISRSDANSVAQREAFKQELDNLFDIADTNALEMLEAEDDRAFLLAQRERGRPGLMMGSSGATFDGTCTSRPGFKHLIPFLHPGMI